MDSERHRYPPINKANPPTSESDVTKSNKNLHSSSKRVYQPPSEMSHLIKSKLKKMKSRHDGETSPMLSMSDDSFDDHEVSKEQHNAKVF